MTDQTTPQPFPLGPNQGPTAPAISPEPTRLQFDLGTFEGFNFHTQSAIARCLTAADVVAWDHDRQGEAEFWPAGDVPGVALIFKHGNSVDGAKLVALDHLLDELGGDSTLNYLRIYCAVNVRGACLLTLTREKVEDLCLGIFTGDNFCHVRRQAAYELFELLYPEEYRVWEKSTCDALYFDPDRFLDSPAFRVEEVDLGEEVAVMVASQ